MKELGAIYTVLIVDDSDIEREGIRFLLGKLGYGFAVHDASSGSKALAILEKTDVDIMLSDIRMPYMDGLELARRAKQLQPKIRIVIFSAYGQFEYAKKAIELGVRNYLLKPVDITEFKNLLDILVSQLDEERAKEERMRALIEGSSKNAAFGGGEHYDLEQGIRQLLEMTNLNQMADISKSLPKQPETVFKPVSADDIEKRKVIEKVIGIIHNHYMDDLNLEMLSERLFLSPSYFSHLFKKETGTSFIKYLTAYRLERAKEYIENTNMKISVIMKKVGYNDLSYFCQLFKDSYGLTPAKYRERI